jgi:hypothetical protein
MTKDEISKFLILAMGIDNRLNPADQNQFIAKVEGWYLALSKSMTFEFAREALGRHYASATDSIMPANLNALWKVELDRKHSENIQNSIESVRNENKGMPDSVRQQLREMGVRL